MQSMPSTRRVQRDHGTHNNALCQAASWAHRASGSFQGHFWADTGARELYPRPPGHTLLGGSRIKDRWGHQERVSLGRGTADPNDNRLGQVQKAKGPDGD